MSSRASSRSSEKKSSSTAVLASLLGITAEQAAFMVENGADPSIATGGADCIFDEATHATEKMEELKGHAKAIADDIAAFQKIQKPGDTL